MSKSCSHCVEGLAISSHEPTDISRTNVFGITGWSNSGKTTLVEKLIADITERGFSVSTIKHAHHAVEVDQKGKDSYRHRKAGASQVLLSAPTGTALMTEVKSGITPEMETLVCQLSPVDLILVEGYKRDNHAKIETHRAEIGKELIATDDPTIKAIATNVSNLEVNLPVLDLNDTQRIANFILVHVGLLDSASI